MGLLNVASARRTKNVTGGNLTSSLEAFYSEILVYFNPANFRQVNLRKNC